MVYWYEKGGKPALEENSRLVRLEAKDDESDKTKIAQPRLAENKSFSSRLSTEY